MLDEGGVLCGDGVNIDGPLQALADPGGGVCISGTVFEQVERKLPVSFPYAAEQWVKNIVNPVRVHHLLLEGESDRAGNRS